jgi:hypothetical protein
MVIQTKRACIVLIAVQLLAPPVAAEEDNLAMILSPADGAQLKAEQVSTLEYEVKPEAKSEHVHLYIDGNEVAIGHKLKGGLPFGPLTPGDHKVCISPVNKAHTRTTAQACITVKVQ